MGGSSAPSENGDRGAVCIFEKLGDRWSHLQKLTLESSAAGDTSGSSVILSGTMLLVGAADGNADVYQRGVESHRFSLEQVVAGARSGQHYTVESRLFDESRERTTYLFNPDPILAMDGILITRKVIRLKASQAP
ncbi:MAG: hypothetical protein ACI9NC_001322 [Verrucomicrobiales bacterium]|jgi:hypothetical protein